MNRETGAFGQGLDAAKECLPESANPYHEQDNHYSQWQLGYRVEKVKQQTKQLINRGEKCDLMNA